MKHRRNSDSKPRLLTTIPDNIAADAPDRSSMESNMPKIRPRDGLSLTIAISVRRAGLCKANDMP